MNHRQTIFDSIILGDLRPWLENNRHEEKFKSEIEDIIPVEPCFQPLYSIEFYPRLNYITRYYLKLIAIEADNYCNYLIELISTDNDTRVIKYLLRNEFKNKVKTQLNDVAKIIKANDYNLKYINPQKSDFSVDKEHKSDTYVMQLLKTALIKVYLEVQEKFKTYISSDDYMEISDLQALADSHNEPSFLRYNSIIDITHVEVKAKTPKIKKGAASKINSFKYKNLATNGDAIINLWDGLTHNSLIDEATSKPDLRKVFSGKDDFKPIVWTGNISDLYYFIVLIHNEYECVENIKPFHWQVTCKCFIKHDGTSFDPGQLRGQKTPKLKASMIQRVATNLM